MSRALAVLRKLRELGMPDAQILDVIETMESAEHPRSSAAERQARYRAKKAAAASDVTRDVTCDATVAAKENAPHTPQKENPPSKENPPKGGQKKGSRLPADWSPNDDDWRQALKAIGIQRAESELAKFRDYWPGVPGEKGRKLDWDATFRNWIRKAAEFNSRAGPQRGGSVLARMASGEFWDEPNDQPTEQHRHGQSAGRADEGGSGFAGPLSQRSGDDGGPLLDLRPEGAGW